jgi:hypothetical protein
LLKHIFYTPSPLTKGFFEEIFLAPTLSPYPLVGLGLVGKDIVLKSIIKYSNFKVLAPYMVACPFSNLIIKSSTNVR